MDRISPVARAPAGGGQLALSDAAGSGQNGTGCGLNPYHFGTQEQQICPLVTSVTDSNGERLLAVRSSDGYVWVSTMLHMFNKKLAHFKTKRDNIEYMNLLADELGMKDEDGRPDTSQLLKRGTSPFDERVEGYYSHIELLVQLATWVHVPYARICHKIVLKFYAGQLTTADSLAAASTIARQLGFSVPTTQAAGRGALAALRTAETVGALARADANRVKAEMVTFKRKYKTDLEDLEEDLDFSRREAEAAKSAETSVRTWAKTHVLALREFVRTHCSLTGALERVAISASGMASATMDLLLETVDKMYVFTDGIKCARMTLEKRLAGVLYP
jgi:hypothetical protein